jgi:hypothetical protein
MPFGRIIAAFLLVLKLSAAGSAAQAQADDASAAASADDAAAEFVDHWRLIASPYAYHYTHKPEHRPIYMLGVERQRSDGWVWGGAYFSNSFGQPSGFAYFGRRYVNFGHYDKLFAQWSAGMLYGYKRPYENEVPFNVKGFSPGAVLSLGWQFTPQYSMQLNQVGTAGIMFQASIDLH